MQTPDHTLRTGIGSCRDSAWLLVSILRQLGLAARFVSGYLVQLTSDVEALDGPSGPAADFTDLHAWTEVYIPGAGWIGLDPTSGLFAGEGHIPLSATPHPDSAAPITGATEPCETTLDFSNVVTRVHEDPRVTLPYTEAAWGAICALGARVDERLAAGDVRLTVGGEPTFVSIDNQVDPEWTTDADGPHKRRARIGPGRTAEAGVGARRAGAVQPGQVVSGRTVAALADRTVLAHRRRTAVDRRALLADPWPTAAVSAIAVAPDAGGAAARRHRRRTRPARLPGAARLRGPAEPADQFRAPAGRRTRRGRRRPRRPTPPTAVPRCSPARPVGHRGRRPRAAVAPPRRRLRLGQRGLAAAARPHRAARGRLARRPAAAARLDQLASAARVTSRRPAGAAASRLRADEEPDAVVDSDSEDEESAPITALVAEIRDGLLRVFLPPTDELEHFVDLVSRVQAAAAKVDCPVVIEGYGPPSDPRITSMTVTPDPGVIEVNVAPTATLRRADATSSRRCTSEARLARLSTESFDVDGTHGGTGGGNHITLGGITPADSPLLRRPDLLVSMLTYWQRHPSLSYLFAGRFVGTTSQAPRVDEGRAEALYELEIAFAEIARLTGGAGTAKPWVTDRALRHLLTDITGNTHRAEFCIDKLYSPDSARGRLGLLELRGFEMPPHFQMAMVQSLLVRSLVAWFWDEPLRAPLIRHGANLHGRYLLPHFLIHDIADVAADLRAHGINFDTSWLDPFTEFRFPRIGTAVFDGRRDRTARRDRAVERARRGVHRGRHGPLRRLVGGADPGAAHRCRPAALRRDGNGYPVPLLATDNPDVQVGGVRFRAWQPPSALHPTITVDGAAALRARRHGHRHVPRRLHLPRVAPRRPVLRHPAGQRGRGRVPPRPPVRGRPGSLPGKVDIVRHPREAGAPIHRRGRAGHPRPAPGAYRSALMASSSRRAVARDPCLPSDIDRPAGRLPRPARAPAGAVRPARRRGHRIRRIRRRGRQCPAILARVGRVRRRARTRRAGTAARRGAQPGRQRRHHLRPGRPQR